MRYFTVMESYTVFIKFRYETRKAHVHKHVDHYGVWLTDSDLIQDFGGLITFDCNKKLLSARKPTAFDSSFFYKAIAEQLR